MFRIKKIRPLLKLNQFILLVRTFHRLKNAFEKVFIGIDLFTALLETILKKKYQ